MKDSRKGFKVTIIALVLFFFSGKASICESSKKQGFAPFVNFGVIAFSVNNEVLAQNYDYNRVDNEFLRQIPLFIVPLPFLSGGLKHSLSQGIFSFRNSAEANLSLSGAGTSFTSSLSISPLFTLFAKAHVETAWNYGSGFELLGIYNPAKEEYDSLDSFSEYSYGLNFGSTAIIPLPLKNLLQFSFTTDYIAFSAAEDGEPWKCGTEYNSVNGWRYAGSVMLAHDFQGEKLKLVGFSASVNGRYSEDDYAKIYQPYNPLFKTYSLSALSQFAPSEKQTLVVMMKASRNRKFERDIDEYDVEATLMQRYIGARWHFDGIMIMWTLNLL